MSYGSGGVAGSASCSVFPPRLSQQQETGEVAPKDVRQGSCNDDVATADLYAAGTEAAGSGGAEQQSRSPSKAPTCWAAALPDQQPFLQQRRLPSILLDNWEFRKLAAEGSVLANAMISYDVDNDGLEEVIVGTTEGLLCVVKPDCRAPLFVRVLAATISVVLYTPIHNRLVLVTLEGQCEVLDNFLKSSPPQRAAGEAANVYGVSSTEGANTFARTPSSRNSGGQPTGGARGGGAPTASPNPAGGHMSTLGNTAISTYHGLSMDKPGVEVVGSRTAQTTNVFHVPSNCLCADLSPESDAEIIFLGSYDRRFYAYSIIDGSCLLSLFLHDPITSVKTFSIPTPAPDAHRARTSSPISIYGKKHIAGATCGPQRRVRSSAAVVDPSMLEGAPCERETVSGRQTRAVTPHCIPLVFLSTPTHLILLPGGLNDIQRWRRLQPKSAHLPLTVQLQSDESAPTQRQSQQSRSQRQHEYLHRRSSTNGGAASATAAALATEATAHQHPRGTHPLEGGGTVPFKLRDAVLTSSSAVSPPRAAVADGDIGCAQSSGTPQVRASGHSGQRGDAKSEHPYSTPGALTAGSHTPSMPGRHRATSVAATPGLPAELALSTSQLRRQTRRRAIQAAEIGRPVLVKPLWALRIGSHVLEVPLLQTVTDSHGNVCGGSTAVAAAASARQVSSGGSIVQQTSTGPAATATFEPRDSGAKDTSVMPMRVAGSATGGTFEHATDSSVFSVSSLSSMSALIADVHNDISSSAVMRTGTGASSCGRRDCRGSDLSRGTGEDTALFYTNPPLLGMGVAAVQNIRKLTRRRQTFPLSPTPLPATSSDPGEDHVNGSGGPLCSSGVGVGDYDDEDRMLSEDSATAVGCRRRGWSRHQRFKTGGGGDEEGDEVSDVGTTTDGDTLRYTSRVSTTTGYNTGSEDSNRGSSSNAADAMKNGGHRTLTSSSARCSRYEHHNTTDPLPSTSPALSLDYVRPESAPTPLRRRTVVADDTREGNFDDSGRQLKRETHAHQEDESMVLGPLADRGGDASLHERHPPRGAAWRESGLQSPHPAQSPRLYLSAAASPPEGPEVRLPTSIDVSVGTSQVAVALSCEDGLALELRFSVVRLSSLSRRERRLPRGNVRLYDMRSPRCLRVRVAGCSPDEWDATKSENLEGELLSGYGGSGSPTQPVGSLACPVHRSTLGSYLRDSPSGRRGRRRRRRRGGGDAASQLTYNIYLPTPEEGPTGALDAVSPQSSLSGPSLASSCQRQRGRSDRRKASVSVAATNRLLISSTSNASGGVGSSMAGDDTGCYPVTAAARRPGVTASEVTIHDVQSGFGRSSGGAQAQRYGEDTIVLRARCLWATRLSDSPLVQRARVFCVRDRHHTNTFCSLFLASNGTCFAVDGDTLSVVECHVKEDCSSFTLMAVPISTTPLLPTGASAVTLGESSLDTSLLTHDEAVKDTSTVPTSFNVLRGVVGSSVSCVCVSVDELCVYSVGEASQLVQHRDGFLAASAVDGGKEVTPLLSRGLLHSGAPYVAEDAEAPHDGVAQEMSDAPTSPLPSADTEVQTILRQLALRLRHLEQYKNGSLPDTRDLHAAAAPEDVHTAETEDDTLMRVKKLLLYDYTEQEWERLQWLDHAVT